MLAGHPVKHHTDDVDNYRFKRQSGFGLDYSCAIKKHRKAGLHPLMTFAAFLIFSATIIILIGAKNG